MKKNSNIIITILLLIIIGLTATVLKKKSVQPGAPDITQKETQKTFPVITITEEKITEENFTGTKSVIKGSSPLADIAQTYIDQTVSAFKQSADEDVPSMRVQFGRDAPTAEYTIDIKATLAKSNKTESIIIDEYTYTGGANGNSSYKVFTASRATGKIVSLGDVIESSKQGAFTALVKKELTNWRPEGSDEPVVFPDEVKNLTFSSFHNWSFDDKNLILYFDKYEIGPGAVGAVAFPLPFSKVKTFLVQGY